MTLPANVFPLNNSTARDSILAIMPQCNANGILPDWKPPAPEAMLNWLEDLIEAPAGEEVCMIHPPRPAEVETMKRRLAVAESSQAFDEDEPAPPPEMTSVSKPRKWLGKKSCLTPSFAANPSEKVLEDEDVEDTPLVRRRSWKESEILAIRSARQPGGSYCQGR